VLYREAKQNITSIQVNIPENTGGKRDQNTRITFRKIEKEKKEETN